MRGNDGTCSWTVEVADVVFALSPMVWYPVGDDSSQSSRSYKTASYACRSISICTSPVCGVNSQEERIK